MSFTGGGDGPFRGGGMKEGGSNDKGGLPPWVILFVLFWAAVCVLAWMAS